MAQQNDKFNQSKDSQKQQPNYAGSKTAQQNPKDMPATGASRQSSDFANKDKTQSNK